MLLAALYGVLELRHVFESWGWLVWPLALVLHFATLKKLDVMVPQRWWSWVHSGGVWLAVLLAGNLLVWGVQQADLRHTAWASVIYLVAGVLVLLCLTLRALYEADSPVRLRWPLNRFVLAYLWRWRCIRMATRAPCPTCRCSTRPTSRWLWHWAPVPCG
jgi:hypothetical protein